MGCCGEVGGDVCRAIGGAEALKNSVLLPLAFPRSTPILMRSMRGWVAITVSGGGHAVGAVAATATAAAAASARRIMAKRIIGRLTVTVPRAKPL